jgi:hypothetical protein
MTRKTIYKTEGGCFRVGTRYFKYYKGALNESTKEECKGQDTFLVDEDVLRDVIDSLDMTPRDDRLVDERGAFTNRRLY